MKKTALLLFALLLALLAGTCISIDLFPKSDMEKAVQFEKRGDHSRALKSYWLALDKLPSVTLPRRESARSMLNPDAFARELRTFLTWIVFDSAETSDTIALMQAERGILRCMDGAKGENFISIPDIKLAPRDTFDQVWRETFFTSAHYDFELLDSVWSRGVSLLTLMSGISYTYHGFIFEQKSGKAITFTLYPESMIRLPVAPGVYRIIVTSIGPTSNSHKPWQSDVDVMTISVPHRPALISTILRTKIHQP